MDTDISRGRFTLNGTVTRRNALRGAGGAGIAAALGLSAAGHAGAAEATAAAFRIEPGAGSWKTWVLQTGKQLELTAPPDDAASQTELAELQSMIAGMNGVERDRISYWNTGSPGYRWNQIAISHGVDAGILIRAYRMLAMMNVAIYDATVAAWNAKAAYLRTRPSDLAASGGGLLLPTAIDVPASPSYPCEHAVAAGAASAVLSYLYPDETDHFADLANQAGRSRMQAGVAYPSDVEAGLALGRQVAELVIARGREDDSEVPWDGVLKEGPGMWTGEPAWPTMGNWKTWVIKDGTAYRPVPPPAWDSPEREAELEEVRSYERDVNRGVELNFWPEDPGGRPTPDTVPISSNQLAFHYAPALHLFWSRQLNEKVFEYRLDTNPPRAARAYALVSLASYDSTVAAWNAKFFYCTARPNQFDPDLTTVLPTYPIPDYPSGHSTTLSSTAEVLAYLFPRDAHYFQSSAAENAASRRWAGIHFRSACDSGLKLGRDVAGDVVARAKSDGAD